MTLRLDSVPMGEDGIRFMDQFLGIGAVETRAQQFPLVRRMFYKKARIMTHWGKKIGAGIMFAVGSQDTIGF